MRIHAEKMGLIPNTVASNPTSTRIVVPNAQQARPDNLAFARRFNLNNHKQTFEAGNHYKENGITKYRVSGTNKAMTLSRVCETYQSQHWGRMHELLFPKGSINFGMGRITQLLKCGQCTGNDRSPLGQYGSVASADNLLRDVAASPIDSHGHHTRTEFYRLAHFTRSKDLNDASIILDTLRQPIQGGELTDTSIGSSRTLEYATLAFRIEEEDFLGPHSLRVQHDFYIVDKLKARRRVDPGATHRA
ncbi:hypothetical protein BCV69DRAFT_301963 [Microstroma glucosiphilum]|uniref:Uncharacterized protein n=1 Tax=Pseudomicrostroma glucosiphilum TaxID=1684307 RepID=A0A316TZA6_9BASI|nr:hypothetical protein BCV69DRAFT_301963 [Pseudomicrostroma glucosiphilum]PWN17661.1 hypothetical protein BCV69DRAFT_301963 [Pseudomicrostroma glucosiphilum]